MKHSTRNIDFDNFTHILLNTLLTNKLNVKSFVICLFFFFKYSDLSIKSFVLLKKKKKKKKHKGFCGSLILRSLYEEYLSLNFPPSHIIIM